MAFIGELDFLHSIRDFTSSSALDGAVDVATTVIGGTTYVFAAGYYDHGIQVLKIVGDELVPVFEIKDSTTLGLTYVHTLEIVTIGRNTYLLAGSGHEDALNSFKIETSDNRTLGHLTHVDTVRDDSQGGNEPALNGVEQVKLVTTAGGTFAVVSAYYDDALSVYRVGNNGTFTRVAIVRDSQSPDYNLDTPIAVEIVTLGKRHFVYVGTDSSDSGLSVFEMSENGQLTSVQHFDIPNYATVRSLTAVQNGNKTYLVAADTYGNRLIVYQVAANGQLSEVSSLPYQSQYSDPNNIESFVVDGAPFILVSSPSSDMLVVYGLDAAGTLVERARHTSNTELDGAAGFSIFRIGSRVMVAVAAQNSDRVSLFELGAQDDVLVGTAGADQMVGLSGDDHLIGRQGNDTLNGGEGDDVVSGGAGNDALYGDAGDDALIGGAGNDTLLGGLGGDVLHGGAGTDTASYASSAEGVTVDLQTGQASGGDASGDVLLSIENLIGSAGADQLTGNAADNVLNGAGGNDTIYGGAGHDRLLGGGGLDQLYGGADNDTLLGAGGNDVLDGGDGNDSLVGGGGNDSLVGGAGSDRLDGGAGRDTLDGGAGDDILRGRAGADVFAFADGFGNDVIKDFQTGSDRIDLRGVTALASFEDVMAIAITFRGDTVLQLDQANSILLEGVRATALSASDFLF